MLWMFIERLTLVCSFRLFSMILWGRFFWGFLLRELLSCLARLSIDRRWATSLASYFSRQLVKRPAAAIRLAKCHSSGGSFHHILLRMSSECLPDGPHIIISKFESKKKTKIKGIFFLNNFYGRPHIVNSRWFWAHWNVYDLICIFEYSTFIHLKRRFIRF